MKKFRLNKKGFTLIELMIVIAIIGVLAAIAIPNFISYRDKSYCSQTEGNARTVAAALANYYAIPSHDQAPGTLRILTDLGVVLNRGTATIAQTAGQTTVTITITDATTRCPGDYRAASAEWGNSATSTQYQLIMR